MGAFKLGKMTFGSLFKKPETVLYPLVEKPKPEGLKGHVAIDVESCILCGMCERSCSTNCITVDKGASTWSIFRLQCVQCGYCITVCPKKCLSMDPSYTKPTTERATETFDVSDTPRPAKKAQEPETSKESKAAEKPEPQKPEGEKAPNTDEIKAEERISPTKHVKCNDEQVNALLGTMDPEKAERVSAILNN